MSDPQPQDDLTADDGKVKRTDNGWKPGDPPEDTWPGNFQDHGYHPERPPGRQSHLVAGLAAGGQAVLDIARSQLGYQDDGNQCQKFGAWYGMNCVAWCAIFQQWVFAQAQESPLIPRTAWTPAFFQWFEQHNQDPDDGPAPGDIVFFSWSGVGTVNPGSEGYIDHVGIVEANLGNGVIQTLEGNTDPPNGGTGDVCGVWRRQRTISPWVAGWGRPAYAGAPPAPTPPPPAPAPPAPAPPAPAPGDRPPYVGWCLPPGNYVGDVNGPDQSHGGTPYDPPNVVELVRSCQRGFIAQGCVPGIGDWRDGWADGRFDAPDSTDAAARWHARFYPGQPYPTQMWSDDYQVLVSR